MKSFNYFQPTEIRFGTGRIEEAGEIVSKYGKKCLLVTVPVFDAIKDMVEKVKKSLKDAVIEYIHYEGAIPNPTTDAVAEGTKVAKKFKSDVVLGMGGGSSIDTAKAIAVEATHDGSSWDYLFFSDSQPTERTLPIIAVTTTAGTGSHVTKIAVISNSRKRKKSAIVNPNIYPRVCIVDPELTLSLPKNITASTGFDVFAHAFESYININTSSFVELIAKEAIRLLSINLPLAVKDGKNIKARMQMSWADTLAGLCITNSGTTLPHSIGQAISGYYPHISHGQSLAAIFPEFMQYSYKSDNEKFAALARIFDKDAVNLDDKAASERSCNLITDFLKVIGMYLDLGSLSVEKENLGIIADFAMELPDYQFNPRVANRNDILNILKSSHTR